MSLTTAALEVLVAKGLSAADILDVARAMEVRKDPTAAERKRRQREREAGNRDVSRRDVTRDETPSPSLPPDPQPNPAPVHTPETRASTRGPFPKPGWADDAVWADFLANRKRKNLANTATAHRKLLADIDRLTDAAWPPGRILEAAVGRGWGGIYSGLKDGDDDGRSTQVRRGRQPAARPGDGWSNALHEAAGLGGADFAR